MNAAAAGVSSKVLDVVRGRRGELQDEGANLIAHGRIAEGFLHGGDDINDHGGTHARF